MNITKMTNLSKKLSIAIKVVLGVKNWTCPILHYFNMKNNQCIAKFRNGTKCIIRDKSDAVVFLENFFLNAYDLEEGFDIKENDVIIDIGAHVGYFTVYAAQKVKDGKIISFEPSKESFQVLENNLKINSIQNVIAENLGVRSKSGDSTLYIDKNHEIGDSMFSNDDSLTKENVQVTSIPEIVKKHKIESIDLMKLDCEGAEYEIILELPPSILNTIKKIAMEVHDIENYSISDIENFLTKNNFQVKRKYLLAQKKFSNEKYSTIWPMIYATNQNFTK